MSIAISETGSAGMSSTVSGASRSMPPQQKMTNLYTQIDTSGAGAVTQSQFNQAFETSNPPGVFKARKARMLCGMRLIPTWHSAPYAVERHRACRRCLCGADSLTVTLTKLDHQVFHAIDKVLSRYLPCATRTHTEYFSMGSRFPPRCPSSSTHRCAAEQYRLTMECRAVL
jgi:hypothetical protein